MKIIVFATGWPSNYLYSLTKSKITSNKLKEGTKNFYRCTFLNTAFNTLTPRFL